MNVFKCILALVLSVTLIIPNILTAATVQNPFADYAQETLAPNDPILYFNVTLSGKPYLFISNQSAVDGKIANIWSIYQQTDTGYIKSDRTVSLARSVLALTPVKDIKTKVLVTYWPHGAQQGALTAVSIEDGKITEHNLGQIEPQGKDRVLYESLFDNPSVKVYVQELLPNKVVSTTYPVVQKYGEENVKTPILPELQADLSWAWYMLGFLVIITLLGAVIRARKGK